MLLISKRLLIRVLRAPDRARRDRTIMLTTVSDEGKRRGRAARSLLIPIYVLVVSLSLSLSLSLPLSLTHSKTHTEILKTWCRREKTEKEDGPYPCCAKKWLPYRNWLCGLVKAVIVPKSDPRKIPQSHKYIQQDVDDIKSFVADFMSCYNW